MLVFRGRGGDGGVGIGGGAVVDERRRLPLGFCELLLSGGRVGGGR
jgi:hypothetical protein